jgi:hypothetical protein
METATLRLAPRGWARLRWLGLGTAIALGLWACNARRLVKPTPELSLGQKHQFQQAVNRKLDLLFLVDDSESMQPLQDKLARNLPVLVHGLTTLSTGVPDLHIAVVSSTSQAGTIASGSCAAGNAPNGSFRHTFNPAQAANHPECDGLKLDGTFIKAEASTPPNFTGKIEDVFSCIALLGQSGCGFEQQFGSIVRALDPKLADPGNAGFLRDDAYLGIVMLTNEDDCSTPVDTHLFDEASSSVATLGRLVSYRCTEFGILCGGQKPPHALAAHTTTELADCVSAEDQGQLVKVKDFESFLLGLKHGDGSKILIAAISGPPAPFAVSTYQSCSSPATADAPMGPGLVPSCGGPSCSDNYADPGVRVAQAVSDLGGVRFDICDEDFSPAMDKIAKAIGKLIEPECLQGTIENDAAGQPDCTVTDRSFAPDGRPVDKALPYCGTNAASFPSPCWRLVDSADCGTGRQLLVCRDPTCASTPTTGVVASDLVVECAIAP